MTKGVCVFDIDGTFTYSNNLPKRDKMRKENAMIESMNKCEELGFGIAVNTARPPQNDILWGIPEKVRNRMEESDISVHFRPSREKNVELRKYKNMQNIANIFEVPVKNTILVDDIRSNCDFLSSRKVPCVEVYDRNGVDTNDVRKLVQKIRKILKY